MMFLLLLLLGQSFHSSDTLVLTKLARAYKHYLKNEKSSSTHDPLDDFTLQGRIQLCDEVLNAKQFMTKYPARLTKYANSEPKAKLTTWKLPAGVSDSDLNFQRSISSQHGGKDSGLLQYNPSYMRMNGASYKTIKKLQCVHTAEIDWFVTYGLVDNSTYLIELNNERIIKKYRMVGILEENPLVDDRGFGHFRRQHEKYRGEMESICVLGIDDHLRLCSAILDTLDKLGSLKRTVGQLNYVEYRNRRCIKKSIMMNGTMSHQPFLRCSFFLEHEDEPSSIFYALADPSKEGAAFVFLEEAESVLKLHTRMVQIGALVNPTGPGKVKLIAEAELSGGKEEMTKAENESGVGGQASTSISAREQRSQLKQKSIKTKVVTPEEGSSNVENTINQDECKYRSNSKRNRFERHEEEERYELGEKSKKIVQQSEGQEIEEERTLETIEFSDDEWGNIFSSQTILNSDNELDWP